MLGRLRPDISLRHPRLDWKHSQRVAQSRPKPQVQSRIVDGQASLLRARPAVGLLLISRRLDDVLAQGMAEHMTVGLVTAQADKAHPRAVTGAPVERQHAFTDARFEKFRVTTV